MSTHALPHPSHAHSKVIMADAINWTTYALLQKVVLCLPYWICWLIARCVGFALYHTNKKMCATAEHNLRYGLRHDAPTARVMARTAVNHFALNLVEFLRFRTYDERWFKRHVTITGLANIHAALAQGKGIIAVGAHIGNFEHGALATKLAGFIPNGIWASHKDERINNLFITERVKKGINVIETGGALPRILEALARNEIVFLMIDYAYTRKGVTVDFCGKQAIIPKGMALAALNAHAPIIPFSTERLPHRDMHIEFGEPVRYSLTGTTHADVSIIAQASVRALEPFIRRSADQWVIFRDCWKMPE